MDDLLFGSAVQIANAIREKRVSCQEVIAAHLRRIEAVNPAINAVVYYDAERALNEARELDAMLARGEEKGALHGVPVTIKDNIRVAGMPCTTGTLGFKSFIAPDDATMVTRLRAAGAIVLGMTNMPELGVAFESDNLVYGRSNNPYDLSRTPGGSSGGEAAIIAAGGSALGLGNDGAGSVRTPAAFCGLVGLKPNQGRMPVTGHVTTSYAGFYPGVSQDGPLARYVEDINLVFPIVAGVDWRDPQIVPMPIGDMNDVEVRGLRAAYYTDDGFCTPTPEIAGAVRTAAGWLQAAGLNVTEARPEGVEDSYDLRVAFYGAVSANGLYEALDQMGTAQVSELVKGFMRITEPYHNISKKELLALNGRLGTFRARMIAFMENYDVIVCPTCAVPAMPHGTSQQHFEVFSYTMAYNLCGFPAVSVRAGTSPEGLPIGVQVVARPWREDVALAAARIIEQAGGGYVRPGI
jgi:amidase